LVTIHEIKRTVADDDIEWLMEWNGKRPDEMVFESGPALALMLLNGVIFLNDHWWEKDWPDDAKKVTSLNVNCNDVFAWACADAEELPYAEIENLYRMWRKDPAWGAEVWCIKRRNQMPQKPVEKAIRKAGVWDLDAMLLPANTQDAETQAMFKAMCKPAATP
jgi:hypothetical protein